MREKAMAFKSKMPDRVKNYGWLIAGGACVIAALTIAAQCRISTLESAAPVTQKQGPGMMVIAPWSRPSPTGTGNGAIYMTLMNEGDQADVLLSAETDVAEVVELHESRLEGDVMKMGPISNIEIPAGASVSLEPGGKHIMLINLKQPLTPGDTLTLILNFEQSGPLTVETEIREGGK
jgi:copper(I)-binding protein